MQDGDHDLDIYAGSWWQANNDMAAAFRIKTRREYAGFFALVAKHHGIEVQLTLAEARGR